MRRYALLMLVLCLLVGSALAVVTPIPTPGLSRVDDIVAAEGNLTEVGFLLFTPFSDRMGESPEVFWGLIFGGLFVALFLRQEGVKVAMLYGILAAGAIIPQVAPEFQSIGYTLLVVALAGFAYLILMKKVR